MSDAAATSPPRTQRKHTFIALAALCVAALVWSRALDNGFVAIDDPYYVTDNALVRQGLTWNGVVSVFTTTHVWNWHPLTMLSHMLDVELFGLEPAGHHATSVLLHLCAAFVLFGAIREATRDPWVAMFVALAFALHPLRVQSVAWVSERKDVLSGLFWFAAMWTHARAARAASAQLSRTHTRTRALRATTFVFGALAMMAKPMAVTLPLTLLLLDAWPLARVTSLRDVRARIVEQLPLLAVALLVSVLTIVAQDDAITDAAARAPELRLAAGIVALPRYLGMIAVPWPLSISHGLYEEQPSAAMAVAAALCIVVVIVATALLWRRARVRPLHVVVGGLWFLITLLPVLGFVQVGGQAVADRYTYVPTVGVFLACAVVVRARVAARAAAVLAVGVLALWSWRTWAEIPAWHDQLTLLSRAVDADPHDTQARTQRAIALGDIGDFAAAAAELEEAMRIRPNAHQVDALGQAYARLGRHAEAVAVLETATTIDASLAKVHVHLAESYAALGMRDDALRAIDRALALEPASARARAVKEQFVGGAGVGVGVGVGVDGGGAP